MPNELLLSTINKLISDHKLNKTYLAECIQMPVGTFKNKLNEKMTQYNFTDGELDALRVMLLNIGASICNELP